MSEDPERILERVERESTGMFGSAAAKAADHFSGRGAPGEDAAEIWGRRVGRALSLIGVLVLGALLIWQLWG